MKPCSIPLKALLLSLIMFVCLTACIPPSYSPIDSHPSHTDGSRIGEITRIIGAGEVRINNRTVHEGGVMHSGDHIQTVGNARATLKLARGGEVFFNADTDPILEWISTSFCKLRILINVGSILVDTPCETEAETGSGAVIKTLGTMFHLTVTPEWTELTVIQGKMMIRSNVGGGRIVPAGFQLRVRRDQPAPSPFPADTRKVTDWACRLDRRLCHETPPPPQPRDVSVPNLIGTELDQAHRTISQYDLELGQVREKSTDRRSDDGRVAAQSPGQGSRVPAGAKVDLVVWRYRSASVRMPMVLNLPVHEAERVLQERGIRSGRIQSIETRNPDQADLVARQTPKADTRIEPDTVVILTVYRYQSAPKPEVKAPDLTGMNLERVRAVLRQTGLDLGRINTEPVPSRRQIGIVFRQKPVAGADMDPGETVDVWVYQMESPQSPILRRRVE